MKTESDMLAMGTGPVIASGTSEARDRDRWTEIKVIFLDQPTEQARGKRWITIVRGCSRIPGEETRVKISHRSTLEGALRVIVPSHIGQAVISQARMWFAANAGRLQHEGKKP